MAARARSSWLEAWERREQPLIALVPWIALTLSAIPVAVLDSHSARTLTLGVAACDRVQ